MELSEQIQDARQGNSAAQKYLFDRLSDPMMAVCCRYLKSREDAEEALLDGFFRFFTHLKEFKFQGEAALCAWIKKIMVNECLMSLRRRHSFSVLTEDAAGEIPGGEEILSGMSAEEIFGLIIQLPVGYRTVFNLFIIEGMGHKEIAEALGIAEGTSKSQLSKAKLFLQKMLSQKGVYYVKRKTR